MHASSRHALAFTLKIFERYGVKSIALFEGIKGLLMLGIALSFVAIFRSSPHRAAEVLITQLHLNPNGHYPQALLMLSKTFTGMQIHIATACGFLYSAIKITEAYGLWHYYHWGRTLGILSIGVLIPYELFEVWHLYSHTKLLILVLNIAIVLYLYLRFDQSVKAF